MNRLFRDSRIDNILIDDDSSASKHDSIALREECSTWRCGGRKRLYSIRRLHDWLISDWHHKRRHMNLPNLDFQPVRSGLFYSLRLGGVWVAADWWLSYFDIDEFCIPLRLEHLTFDLNREVLPLLPVDSLPFKEIPTENSRPFSRESFPYFSDSDHLSISANNPRWSNLEAMLYQCNE